MTPLNNRFTEQLQQFATDNDHSFRSFSPTAKVPCVLDGEVVAWESLAIVECLAERYPGCLRDDNPTKSQRRMNSPLRYRQRWFIQSRLTNNAQSSSLATLMK